MFEQFWNAQAFCKDATPEQKANAKNIWLSGYLTCFIEITQSVASLSDKTAELYLMRRNIEAKLIIEATGCAVLDGRVEAKQKPFGQN